jgi:DNA-directed RNA polymerase specialized sigma24 family protein
MDRQILRLTLVDGCKPGEIAQNLKLHPDVVRARKSRALKKIRQAITSRVTKRQAVATQTIRGGT